MSDSAWTRSLEIDAGHPAFDGHFPGQPVLPGVAMLAEVVEAAAAIPAAARCLGAAPRLVVAKFLGAVRPGASLVISLRIAASTLDWSVAEGPRTMASGRFARGDLAAAAP